MKVPVAAIQMHSTLGDVRDNLERAGALVQDARCRGAELVVLPELFQPGYGRSVGYESLAEPCDGFSARVLAEWSRRGRFHIAAGIAEFDGGHLYNTLLFCKPDGSVTHYRKRNLVFWERGRFYPGRSPVVVPTPWGRVGFAICADMLFRRVWRDYRDRIDLAVVASAWPEFSCQVTGRAHWLLGRLGQLAGELPARVSRDLGIPVVFANQCGPTTTVVPVARQRIADAFAGKSGVFDHRHGLHRQADRDGAVVLAEVVIHGLGRKGPKAWGITSRSARAVS